MSTQPGPPTFLTDLFASSQIPRTSNRCSVTLTFAQSVDAKIAGAGGQQLILSGRESMVMTHWSVAVADALKSSPKSENKPIRCTGCGQCTTAY